MSATKSRTEILTAVLAAFAGMTGNLTEQEWNTGIAIVEGEFDSDLDAVAAYLRSEQRACETVCRVSEAKAPRARVSSRTVRRGACSTWRHAEKG
jgi:hypothetical protein